MAETVLLNDGGKRAFIQALYHRVQVNEEAFDASFLNAVPAHQLKQLITELRAQFGPAERIIGNGEAFTIQTPSHELPVLLVVSNEGLVTGLLFQQPVALSQDIDETIKRLTALGSSVSVLVKRQEEMPHALNPDLPLAVGSAFKLGVLAALLDKIDQGNMGWDTVVRLEEGDKSLPSGMLQNLPTGSPLTVHSAAALMIAESDNTATDLLMRLVGRQAVDGKLGIGQTLTTREFFILKANGDLRDAYLANDRENPFHLDGLADQPLPPASAIGPHNPGIEWYIPATRLCGLLRQTANAEVTRINPGVADPKDWASVSFKGGSEVGVLNFSTRMVDEDGDTICAVLTINRDGAIDEGQATGLYTRLLRQLAELD